MKISIFFAVATISSFFYQQLNSSDIHWGSYYNLEMWPVDSRQLPRVGGKQEQQRPSYGARQGSKKFEQIGFRTIKNVWKTNLSNLMSVALEVVALKQTSGVINTHSQRAEVNRGESIDLASISTNIQPLGYEHVFHTGES
jgi:hypothetical protein